MDDVVEIIEMWKDEDGSMKGHVRLASGLEVIRSVKSVSLEAQITRADGTVEPKQLLSKTTNNPVTNQRLRKEGVGEVHLRENSSDSP